MSHGADDAAERRGLVEAACKTLVAQRLKLSAGASARKPSSPRSERISAVHPNPKPLLLLGNFSCKDPRAANDLACMGQEPVPRVEAQLLLTQQLESACPEATGDRNQLRQKAEASTEIVGDGERAMPLKGAEPLGRRLATTTQMRSVAHTAMSTSPSVQNPQRGSRKLTPDELDKIALFVRENLERVTKHAAKFVGRVDAKDVTQNAFFDLVLYVRNMPQCQAVGLLASDKALRAVMFKITFCEAVNILRARKRNREDLTTEGALEAGDEKAMRHSYAAVDVARLEKIYSAMPPTQRLAHVLHHYYGYTAAECAALLNAALKELNVKTRDLTVTGVETLIFRATKALKHAMEMKP